MSHVTHEEQIKSIESTIRKLEKTVQTLISKNANTSLAEKRLKAHRIALSTLQNSQSMDEKEALEESRNVLKGLLPSLEKAYQKQKAGSAQRTLLARRIQATKIAVDKLDEYLQK